MFGSIGGFEVLVLAAIGLLVFGPRRLPEIGRTLGRAMAEFRKAALEVRTSIEREIQIEDLKETGQSIARALPANPIREAVAELTRPEGEAEAGAGGAGGPQAGPDGRSALGEEAPAGPVRRPQGAGGARREG